MTTVHTKQKYIDKLVYAFGTVMVLGFIGMMADIPVIMFLAVPASMGILLYLSVSDIPDPRRKGMVYGILHVFNLVSVALWVTALVTLDNTSQWLGGLPPSTAVLFLIGWPFYTIVGGIMYAYISSVGGILRKQEAEVENEVMEA